MVVLVGAGISAMQNWQVFYVFSGYFLLATTLPMVEAAGVGTIFRLWKFSNLLIFS